MPHFICPSCGDRSISSERTAGFRNQARGCARCGYGFLFELLDDYYPSPNAAFVVCDQEARVISCGKGVRELTGLGDNDTIGRPVREVLGLEFQNGELAYAPTAADHAPLLVADHERGVGRRVV